jgi:hypothetical protein
MKIKL